MRAISRLAEANDHQSEAFPWPGWTPVPWGQIIQNEGVQNVSTPIQEETKFLGSHCTAFRSVLALNLW